MGTGNNHHRKIFISYAREDTEAAIRLHKELKNTSLEPWLDKVSLLGGQNWENEIKKAIRTSKYFIPVFSSTSVKKRGFVQKEFRFALEMLKEIPEDEIFVIPVRLDNCIIPFEKLRKYHHVDLFPSWKYGIQKVLVAMGLKTDENPDDLSPKLNKEKESIWKNFLKLLKEKRCIPFIGEDAFVPLISSDYKNLSSTWAEEYNYPLDDSTNLSRVSQFLAIDNGNYMFPKNELSEILKKIEPPDFSLDNYRNTPYSVLAELKLPIYITTNYDHFMEAALISRGRQPISDFCRWNEHLLKDEIYTDLSGNLRKVNFSFSETKMGSILDQASDYKPTEDRPLVYHLFGDMAAPESMVLTERDYFDFVINLNKNDRRKVLHPIVYRIIPATPLLLIGYRLGSIAYEILFRSICAESQLYNILVLPQLSTNKYIRAQEYIDKYAKDVFSANTFWNEPYEFSKELRSRWNNFRSSN